MGAGPAATKVRKIGGTEGAQSTWGWVVLLGLVICGLISTATKVRKIGGTEGAHTTWGWVVLLGLVICGLISRGRRHLDDRRKSVTAIRSGYIVVGLDSAIRSPEVCGVVNNPLHEDLTSAATSSAKGLKDSNRHLYPQHPRNPLPTTIRNKRILRGINCEYKL